jgi:S1-C subfamily serine protease
VTPNDRKPHSRMLIPLLVAALGIALGAGGIALLRPLNQASPPRLAATAASDPQASAAPLTQAAIRARIEPSIVDVTAALTYDDETASGTGFVVDAASQFILTNNHVLRDATSVTVTVPATGQSYPARIVGVDVAADIAVLQITPPAPLPGAPLGDSATVSVGMSVISFGNQAGAGGAPAVASGVISGTDRTIQANDGASGFTETLHGMLATTAKIQPGDSGGPLAGPAGTVIGVDTAAGTGSTATGYAIPINTALSAERQIAAGHRGGGVTLGTEGFLGVITGSGTAHSPRAQEHGGTVTAASVAARPVTTRPVSGRSVTGRSVTGRSLTARTVTGRSVTRRSVSGRSITARTVTGRSVTRRSVSGRSITAQTVTGRSVTPRSVSGRSITAQTVTGRSGTPRSVSGRSFTAQTVTGRSGTPRSGTPRSVSGRSITAQTVTGRSVTRRSATAAAVSQKPVTAACLASGGSAGSVKAPATVARAAAGALVYGVLCGTGAATAGISAGDVITGADGRHIVSPRTLTALLRSSRPGAVISVTWVSTSGASRTARVRLSQAPAI